MLRSLYRVATPFCFLTRSRETLGERSDWSGLDVVSFLFFLGFSNAEGRKRDKSDLGGEKKFEWLPTAEEEGDRGKERVRGRER